MTRSKARFIAVVLTGAAFAAAGPGAASVDNSAPPGGVYRLKPGIYVQKGVACNSPPNAAIRQYDGRGISTPHTHACQARVLARKGTRHTVSQSCIDAGTGSAPRTTEKQVVDVVDTLTFTLQTRGPGTTYRYCPASLLPGSLQGAPK